MTNKNLSDEELEAVVGGSEGNEIIIAPFLESCAGWRCRKCGGNQAQKEYHRCEYCITRTVCRYCYYFSDGKCNHTKK